MLLYIVCYFKFGICLFYLLTTFSNSVCCKSSCFQQFSIGTSWSAPVSTINGNVTPPIWTWTAFLIQDGIARKFLLSLFLRNSQFREQIVHLLGEPSDWMVQIHWTSFASLTNISNSTTHVAFLQLCRVRSITGIMHSFTARAPNALVLWADFQKIVLCWVWFCCIVVFPIYELKLCRFVCAFVSKHFRFSFELFVVATFWSTTKFSSWFLKSPAWCLNLMTNVSNFWYSFGVIWRNFKCSYVFGTRGMKYSSRRLTAILYRLSASWSTSWTLPITFRTSGLSSTISVLMDLSSWFLICFNASMRQNVHVLTPSNWNRPSATNGSQTNGEATYILRPPTRPFT